MNKEMILSLLDKVIKVDRGGPESRVGKLLAAEEDHITLLTEDEGIIYYNTHHIKSITDNAKNAVQFGVEIPEDFEFVKAKDFKGVLENLKYRWVKINRGGPETLEGVMDSCNDDFVTIVSNAEIIRLSIFHIRNISYGVKIEKENENDAEGNNQEKEKVNNKQKDSKSK
jgi:spore coat protein B